MSHALLVLRPAAQGVAVTVLVALAGCGGPSSTQVATPDESAPISELQSVAPQGALAKAALT
ncbi:hypothetical protein, partial [Corynebacterium pseudodiphtheriticum]|uniref:hypothetical protein n=1 Tax=Corynebacterium pseudodiphtheriticum TaxID=37637 RepID=UPI001931003E